MGKPDEEQERRTTLRDLLGVTPEELDAVAAQGLSFREAVARGILKPSVDVLSDPDRTAERLGETIRVLQESSVALGLDKLTEEEIDAEIDAVRAELRGG